MEQGAAAEILGVDIVMIQTDCRVLPQWQLWQFQLYRPH